MKYEFEQENLSADIRKNIIRRIIQIVLSIIIIALSLFLSAGIFTWVYAWVYLIASVLIVAINAFVFSPELISERGRKKENVEKWDTIITNLILVPWIALYILSGLDFRFGWSPAMSIWIHLMGLFFYLAGNAFVSWAMVANIYFSTAVRIQYDRGHKVAKNGPYHYMRHPGYFGMIIYLLSSPVILGSIWALIPAIFATILFIIRTALEDNTLKEKLEGYSAYTDEVKYRLIPGIW